MDNPNVVNNLKEQVYGTLEDYAESFYLNFKKETGYTFSQAEKDQFAPMIEEAHTKGIPTMELIAIFKEGMIS